MFFGYGNPVSDRARLPIFDEIERTLGRPASYAEPTFTFLNRIGGEFWDDVRRLLQTWADRFPDGNDYADLRSRLRSRDNEQHRSALLELYLHESLLRAGYEVTIHPTVDGSKRHPDFLAIGESSSFYLEAVAPSKGRNAIARERRTSRLYDVLDQVQNPNFYLHIQDYSQGPKDASAAKLKRDIERWLDTLNPDDIAYDNAPVFNWANDGWHIDIRPIPIRADRRGEGSRGRAIGISGPGRAASKDDAPAILRALESKRIAYGRLDRAYIVAVGTDIFGNHKWDVENALYGPDVLRFGPDPDDVTRGHEGRGFFLEAGNWRNKHVSAVLAVNGLSAWKPTGTVATLWKHPQATAPISGDLDLAAAQIELQGDELIELEPRRTVAELLDLSEPWPSADPWSNRSPV